MSITLRIVLLSCLGAAPLALGCGSTPPSGPAGGPVTGAADEHCKVAGTLVPHPVGICVAPGTEDAGAPPASDDGGAEAGATAPEFGDPMFNSEGYDDDCKYKLTFTVTPVRKNTPVTFTVTIVGLEPAGPATKADLYAEVFLSDGDMHPAPNSNTTTTETPAGSGVYKVGPIIFNTSGRWIVRFHMFDTCSDGPEDSPHGHAAFFIDVP
jgi:hypothetical protein